jgi:hypothetical protein
MYKCHKCSKKFKSEYLLDKHVNKKISCDIVIKCEKCNKIFESIFILNNHLKRKTPCNNFNSQIQNSNIELKKLEIELKKLELKNKLDIEREKMKNKKEIELKKLELKDKIEREKMENKTNNELIKSKRKGTTSVTIKNENKQNHITNVTNTINNNYNNNNNNNNTYVTNNIIIDEDKREKKKEEIYIDFEKNMYKYYTGGSKLEKMLVFSISHVHNNEQYPEMKYYKCMDDILFKFTSENKYEPIEFAEAKSELDKVFGRIFNIFIEQTPVPNITKDEDSYEEYSNFNGMIHIKRNKNYELEKYAKQALT